MNLMTLTIELGPKTRDLLEKLMADLTTAVTDLTAAVTNVTAEISTLLNDLQAAIAANNPTAIQAAADAIEVQVKALNDSVTAAQAATIPTVPAPPAA